MNDASTARSGYVTEKTQQVFAKESAIKQSKESALKDGSKVTMKLESDLNLNAEGTAVHIMRNFQFQFF